MARFLSFLFGVAVTVSFCCLALLLAAEHGVLVDLFDMPPHTPSDVLGYGTNEWGWVLVVSFLVWVQLGTLASARTAARIRDRALRETEILKNVLGNVLKTGGNTAFQEAERHLQEIVRKGYGRRIENVRMNIAAVRQLIENSRCERTEVDSEINAIDTQVSTLIAEAGEEVDARDALVRRATRIEKSVFDALPIGWYEGEDDEPDYLDFDDDFEKQYERLKKLKKFLDKNDLRPYVEMARSIKKLIEQFEGYEGDIDLSDLNKEVESLVDELVEAIPGLAEDYRGFSFEVDSDAVDEQATRAEDALATFKNGVQDLAEKLARLQALAVNLSEVKKTEN